MLKSLKPTKKFCVYDLVEQVGHDMSDWHTSAKRCAVRANPKYCYEWSFTQDEKPTVLSLWHDMMNESDNGVIEHETSFRPEHSGNLAQGSWRRRANALDSAVRQAWQTKTHVRVVINHGERRRAENAKITRSHVLARELDPKPWQVVSYDQSSGKCVIRRT